MSSLGGAIGFPPVRRQGTVHGVGICSAVDHLLQETVQLRHRAFPTVVRENAGTPADRQALSFGGVVEETKDRVDIVLGRGGGEEMTARLRIDTGGRDGTRHSRHSHGYRLENL